MLNQPEIEANKSLVDNLTEIRSVSVLQMSVRDSVKMEALLLRPFISLKEISIPLPGLELLILMEFNQS